MLPESASDASGVRAGRTKMESVHASRDMMKTLSKRPWFFAVVTVALYTLLLLPMAASRNFDLSVFIYAGDTFVNSAKITAPIAIVPGSLGYDGQFFYRFAVDPLSTDRSAHGITLDTPAKRMQRIGYPLLAEIVSVGRINFVPASLLAINLAGLGVIAACTAWMTRRHGLRWWLPFAITAWPGFLVSLTHDTAEITTVALLLTALACYLSDRLPAYCMLAAASALTRETTIPVLLGLFAYETYRAATSPPTARRFGRVVLCALAFVPFGIWWEAMGIIWHQPPQPLIGSPDLGWPLVGLSTMLLASLDGTRIWNADPLADLITRTFVVLTTCGLIAFCIVVAIRIPRFIRFPGMVGLVIGWLLLLALMSLLTAGGPLVEPLSYFRAFTECWVIGCLLLAHGPPHRIVSRSMTWLATFAAVGTNWIIWKWSFWLISRFG